MNVNLDFGNYNNYNVSESRISRMMQADRKSATHINLWDKIKDFFRTDKKADACKELYNLLHNTEGSDKFDSFNKLKSFASPEHQQYFTKEIYCDDVFFLIGNDKVGQSSIQKLMNISEQAPLQGMSILEQRLFLDMIDTLREKELLYSQDYRPSYIRTLMSDKHCDDLVSLYRPQEGINTPGTEWKNPKSIDYKESNLLRGLNRGSMKLLSQFSFMGYQKTASDVEFTMLHPSINYLLDSYVRPYPGQSPVTDLNSSYLKVLNETYQNYYNNKAEIDAVLKKVYDAHDGTLNISHNGVSNNKLVVSLDSAMANVFQPDDFHSDLSRSLDYIYDKWARVDEIIS